MSPLVRFTILAVLLLVFGPTARSLGAGPVISEFMASNDTVLKDEDGDYSDWIEIYNPDASPVDLDGWFLTDDAAILTKWRFPAVDLEGGGFLVVFASGKNRRNPGSELHTNFKLAMEGGYLALVNPGGTVAMDFGPSYPPQVGDVSYGLAQNAIFVHLIASGAPSYTLIPTADIGLSWTQVVYNTGSWTSGTTGVGYDRDATYVPLIKTNVRTAMDGKNTTAYIRIPFTLTDAAKIKGLLFRMKYDDGFILYLNGTRLDLVAAGRNAPNPPSWNSATLNGAIRDDSLAVVFEEIELSQYAGLLREGQNVLAIHGLNANLPSSDFLILPELDGVGVGELQPDVKQYFPQPTPRWGNLPGYPGVAGMPQFSEPSRVFAGTMVLELATVSESAVIRYTLNGSEPTQSSPAYSSPISLTGTTMVRAKAFEGDLAPSSTVTETYLRLDPGLLGRSSNLPFLIVDTFGQGVGEFYVPAFAAVMEPGQDGRSRMSAAPTWSGRAAIHLHGSSSLGFPKNNFNMETRDDHGNDLKVPLLGFSEQSDWILYAPYTDKTLMRDYLSYFWSNGIGRYAPRGRFVEAYINRDGGDLGSQDYMGVYVVLEKIKLDEARVDIHKMHVSDADLSGGYILKKDRWDADETYFDTSQGHRLVFVEPRADELTPAQLAWIKGFIGEFEATLYGANFKDPVNGYAKYIDVDSFIDHHIMVEMTKNIDGFRLSTFMYKDRGKKLCMGPIWDYNLTLGNANYLDGWIATGWYNALISDGDYPWYRRLLQDPEFAQRYADRWALHRRGPFQAPLMMADIDRIVNLLSEAEPRDHVRWPILGTYVWPNPNPIPPDYPGEIEYLNAWLDARLEWFDSNYAIPPSFNQYGGPISPGFSLTVTGPQKLYYTLNGSDPRLPGGAISPQALQYKAPVVLNENTRVIARSRILGWSAQIDATFVVKTPPLVITEVMYHPEPPLVASLFDPEDFEFLELQNNGDEPLGLAGFHLGVGIEFTFPAGLPDLAPGGLVVVAKNLAAFAERYPQVETFALVTGEYAGRLSNGGDSLVLEGPIKEPILNFSYSDTWQPTTDGAGYSLVLVDRSRPLSSWGEASSWKPSGSAGGSPGVDEENPPVGGRQVPGDGNQDGTLDLSDAINLLARIFLAAAAPLPCGGGSIGEGGNLPLFDSNHDQGVDLTDVVYVLNHLFQDGLPPFLGTSCVRIEGCPDVCP